MKTLRPVSTRRRFVAAAVGIGAVSLAGCGSNGENGDGASTLPGDDYPTVDEWLTETDIGAAAPNYEGTILDRRGQDTVTVEVGAGETGQVFGPPAVAVSAGTTVRWAWTGRGGAHNVEAEPDDQIGASDYEFSSGEAVDSSSKTFERTLDSAGLAIYHCEPHLPVGMKGAVIVE